VDKTSRVGSAKQLPRPIADDKSLDRALRALAAVLADIVAMGAIVSADEEKEGKSQ
jgi:hypothetical protein